MDKTKARKVVKTVIGITSGLCVSAVVGAALRANLPVPQNALQKAVVFIGVGTIGSMVANAGEAYWGKSVDIVFDAIEMAEKAQEEIQNNAAVA